MRAVTYRRVLIVGTSRAMTDRIARTLGMPRPSTLIAIDDITSREELAEALRHRRRNLHAVPVPPALEKQPLLFSLGQKVLSLVPRSRRARAARVNFHSPVASEKLHRGAVRSSPTAIHQMVVHCVREYNAQVQVERVAVSKMRSPPVLEVSVLLAYGKEGADRLHGLREHILMSLEKYSGLLFSRVILTVEGVAQASADTNPGSPLLPPARPRRRPRRE